jgi:hypothetical protein
MHVGSGLDTVRNSGPGHWLGHRLAGYLNRPRARYRTFSVHGCSTLERFLQPGDVLLVEGELRISSVIKYLTQSTWSHAALYVGDALLTPPDGCGGMLVEADIEQGVIAVPVGKYARLNTRICRPVGLDAIDRRRVVQFMVSSLGKGYDLDNVIDLVRYLVPLHAPARYRRRLLALGSGDPTRSICSTLIAQAFQSVRYPILPRVESLEGSADGRRARAEIMHIRHHSLFVPRDFDLSPYFDVVKPTLASRFDYKTLVWSDEHRPEECPGSVPEDRRAAGREAARSAMRAGSVPSAQRTRSVEISTGLSPKFQP